MVWVEVIGIISSVLVLASFLMKDMLFVRLINIAGAIGFVVYGILIKSFSNWFINSMLIIIHTIYIVIELRAKKSKKSKVASVNKVEEKTEEK